MHKVSIALIIATAIWLLLAAAAQNPSPLPLAALIGSIISFLLPKKKKDGVETPSPPSPPVYKLLRKFDFAFHEVSHNSFCLGSFSIFENRVEFNAAASASPPDTLPMSILISAGVESKFAHGTSLVLFDTSQKLHKYRLGSSKSQEKQFAVEAMGLIKQQISKSR
ncbi:MAG: hypothetical protein LBJ11_01545 [Oscillospiraceae bacterium]|nr:hypothetical protein [Oscillospiraceae bacterium]